MAKEIKNEKVSLLVKDDKGGSIEAVMNDTEVQLSYIDKATGKATLLGVGPKTNGNFIRTTLNRIDVPDKTINDAIDKITGVVKNEKGVKESMGRDICIQDILEANSKYTPAKSLDENICLQDLIESKNKNHPIIEKLNSQAVLYPIQDLLENNFMADSVSIAVPQAELQTKTFKDKSNKETDDVDGKTDKLEERYDIRHSIAESVRRTTLKERKSMGLIG